MKDDTYSKTFNELQEKWKCSKPGHKFCYLPEGDRGKHFNLAPRDWSLWTRTIMEKRGVFDYPPRMPEFDHFFEKKSKSEKGKHRSHHSDSDSGHDKGAATQAIRLLAKHLPPVQTDQQTSLRKHSDPYSSPVKTRKGATNGPASVPVTKLLAKKGYSPAEYNNRVLQDYEIWLFGKYPDLNFDQSFASMKKHGIGGDVLGEGTVDAVFLMQHCEVMIGNALRICKDYKEWLMLPDKKDDNNDFSFDNEIY